MSKQLGSAIKSMRKSRDWTQAKLGELLNVSDKTISSWEKGRTEPKLEEMIRIADIFNISVTSLSNLPWEHLKASSDSSQWIPVMGRVAAGIPLGMIADDILDYEEIPSSMGWCFALRIQGDSMSPDIPDMTFHQLRHVFATVGAMLNVPSKVMQEKGGWKTSHTMEKVYQHTFTEERQKADDEMDRYFEQFV